MQHEHDFLVPHRVDGAVGATLIVLNDFQHSGAAEALERLGCVVLLAVLSEVQCMSEGWAHCLHIGSAHPLAISLHTL